MTEAIESSTPSPPQSLGSGRTFRDFQLAPDVLEALSKMGIETPTPIQEATIPPILEGRDVVGKAETGTGKTIGFGAPLVGRIDTQRVAVQALILTPTRELAQQVAGVIELLGAGRGLGVALVVGGVHASEQVLKLRSGSQVVVGTPGRVLEFLRDRTLSLVWCETVVLDEADRMLDMGFIDDVSAIIEKVPDERQTLLFSATIPPAIKTLLGRYMKDPAMHSTSKGLSTVAAIKQLYVEADFKDKFRALEKILDAHADGTALIFCNTRRQAIDLDRMLWGHGYSGGALHGDQEQDVRFKILEAFRNGDIKILVATDVASRGLDIEDIACVVNYEIPDEPESYVHRIGRTGRAQKLGEAISIVSGKEWGYWQRILRETGFAVERVGPERIGKTGGSGRGRGGHGEDRGERHRGGRGERDGPARLRGERGRGRGMRGGSKPISNSTETKSGERFVAQEHENPNAAQAGGGTRPESNDVLAQQGANRVEGQGGERSEAGGQRSRRRRRRGRGGSGGGAGGGGGERGSLPRESSAAPRTPLEPEPSPPEMDDDGPGEGPESFDSGRAAGQGPPALADLPAERPKAPRPPRMKLEDLNDEYLKTDYFDIDYSLVERAGPPPSVAGGGGRPEGGRGGGRRPDGRGGGQRPVPGQSGGGGGGTSRPAPRPAPRPQRGSQPRGGGHQPHPQGQGRPESGPRPPRAEGGGSPQEGGGGAGDGQRRRRRRRRGRGQGGGGGGQGQAGGSGGGGGGGPAPM